MDIASDLISLDDKIQGALSMIASAHGQGLVDGFLRAAERAAKRRKLRAAANPNRKPSTKSKAVTVKEEPVVDPKLVDYGPYSFEEVQRSKKMFLNLDKDRSGT